MIEPEERIPQEVIAQLLGEYFNLDFATADLVTAKLGQQVSADTGERGVPLATKTFTALTTANEHCERQRSEIKSAQTSLEAKVQQLESELAATKDSDERRIEKLTKDLATARETIGKLSKADQELIETRAQLDRFTERFLELSKTQSKTQPERESLKAENQQLRQELDSLRASLDLLRTTMKDSVSSVETERNNAVAELSLLKEKLKEQASALQSLEQQHALLKSESGALHLELQSKLGKQTAEHTEQIQTLEKQKLEQIETLEKQKLEQIQTLQSEAAALRAERDSLREQLAAESKKAKTYMDYMDTIWEMVNSGYLTMRTGAGIRTWIVLEPKSGNDLELLQKISDSAEYLASQKPDYRAILEEELGTRGLLIADIIYDLEQCRESYAELEGKFLLARKLLDFDSQRSAEQLAQLEADYLKSARSAEQLAQSQADYLKSGQLESALADQMSTEGGSVGI